jgi:hypothetical protein
VRKRQIELVSMSGSILSLFAPLRLILTYTAIHHA